MAPGPPPKRDAERRRRNEKQKADKVEVGKPKAKPPTADKTWHPLAKRFYQSLIDSGQSRFYEPSDWMMACTVMELLSVELRRVKPAASMIRTLFSQLGDLGVTEGERRRLRIEIERKGEEPPAGVSVLDDYRNVQARKS